MTAAPGEPQGSCLTVCPVASALITGTVSFETSGVSGCRCVGVCVCAFGICVLEHVLR